MERHFVNTAKAFVYYFRVCWAKLERGHGRILVRVGANAG
jgi:hypothetical protein